MINERVIELIHGEIDGALSSGEIAELHRYLDTHPEARTFYQELCEVDSAVRAGGGTEPPENLKESIVTRARSSGQGASSRGQIRSPRIALGWLRRIWRTRSLVACLLFGYTHCAAKLAALLGSRVAI